MGEAKVVMPRANSSFRFRFHYNQNGGEPRICDFAREIQGASQRRALPNYCVDAESKALLSELPSAGRWKALLVLSTGSFSTGSFGMRGIYKLILGRGRFPSCPSFGNRIG